MPLRLYHLPGMHVGKFLGNVVQRYHLAVPGLRSAQWFRKSIAVRINRSVISFMEYSIGHEKIYLTEIE